MKNIKKFGDFIKINEGSKLSDEFIIEITEKLEDILLDKTSGDLNKAEEILKQQLSSDEWDVYIDNRDIIQNNLDETSVD